MTGDSEEDDVDLECSRLAKVEALRSLASMTPAQEQAFRHRKNSKTAVYAYEQAVTAEFAAPELRVFKRENAAWNFFEATLPGYKKVMLHWVITAK